MGGCFIVLIAIFVPRIVLAVWFFVGSLSDAFQGFLLPIVGFLFLPCLTVAFAVAFLYGEVFHLGWAMFMGVAFVIDLLKWNVILGEMILE